MDRDRHFSIRRITLQAIVIGCAVAAGYVGWRWDLGLVWDDTSTASLVAAEPPADFGDMLRQAFSQVQGGGYRPLSNLLGRFGAEAAEDPVRRPAGWIVANGLLFGLLAVVQFLTARRFGLSALVAGYATFLFMASPPILTGGLVLFAGIQSLVPLCFGLAFLLHDRVHDSDSRWVRIVAAVGLGAVFVLSPWYREFCGLICVLVLARDVAGKRQPTWIAVTCVLAFLHALFPTAVMRLAFSELPVAPVYRLGALGAIVQPLPDHISPGTVARAIAALHWRIFSDLVSVLPPLAVLIALVGLASSWRAVRVHRLEALPSSPSPVSRLPSSTDWFLWLWFAVTFLPFLKAFKIQVHLAYALMPLTILVAKYGCEAWIQVGKGPRFGIARLAIATSLAVAAADHALNPWIVHGTTRAISAAIRRRAKCLREEWPHGTPVLCNALQVQDIYYASGQHIGIWSLRGGTPVSGDAVPGVADLRRRLATLGELPAVALDVRLPSSLAQLGVNRNHYVVEEQLVSLDGLCCVDQVRFRYPVLDPLKLLTPIRTTAWSGPPDLEFDFYRGPALDSGLGMREVAADYWQARIAGRDVADWQPDPVLIREQGGCNIVLLGSRYYAIPVSDGAFRLDRFLRKDYAFQAEADSVQEVTKIVNSRSRGGQHQF